MRSKITSYEDYQSGEAETIVLVGGCFDIVHIGHIRFLHNARQQGTYLIVALESDEFIEKKKKRPSFHSQTERAEVLSEIRSVDEVLLLPYLFDSEDYKELVLKVSPHIIAVTEGDPNIEKKFEHARLVNSKVEIVMNYLENKSTSQILKIEHKENVYKNNGGYK